MGMEELELVLDLVKKKIKRRNEMVAWLRWLVHLRVCLQKVNIGRNVNREGIRIPGKNIRYHRLCGGISQAELAAKVGIGKMAISNYECGERVPSMVILKKIAEV